jgi:hypothetical protein
MLPDFQTYYKAKVMKPVCKWHIQSREIKPYIYEELIFDKGAYIIR